MRQPKLTATETATALARYVGDRNRPAVYRLTAYAEQESVHTGDRRAWAPVAAAGRAALVALTA